MTSDSELALARAVLVHGPVSRTDLRERLDVSPATLTRLTKSLAARGLVVELDAPAHGQVGRPGRVLDIAAGLGRFVGVKLTGDHAWAVRTDARCTPLSRAHLPLPDPDPAAVVGVVADLVARLTSAAPPTAGEPGAPAAGGRLTGLGVSLGGLVVDGLVDHADYLGWKRVPLTALLAERLGVPVTVENDVVALTEGEHWFGAGRGLDSFALLTLGAGTGFGLVTHGRLVRSPDAGVGTAGHLPLGVSDAECSEGHVGCAAATVTTESVERALFAALGRAVTLAQALELVGTDPHVDLALRPAARGLGRLLSLVTNLTLTDTVVLAGEGVGLYEALRGDVLAELRHQRHPTARPVRVLVDHTGFEAWARGAAGLAVRRALDARIAMDPATDAHAPSQPAVLEPTVSGPAVPNPAVLGPIPRA